MFLLACAPVLASGVVLDLAQVETLELLVVLRQAGAPTVLPLAVAQTVPVAAEGRAAGKEGGPLTDDCTAWHGSPWPQPGPF